MGKLVYALDVNELPYDNAEIIDVRFIKPLDTEGIRKSVLKTKKCVVLECGTASGGLGEAVATALSNTDVKILLKNIPDTFVEHGKVPELMKKQRIDFYSVYEDVMEELFK